MSNPKKIKETETEVGKIDDIEQKKKDSISKYYQMLRNLREGKKSGEADVKSDVEAVRRMLNKVIPKEGMIGGTAATLLKNHLDLLKPYLNEEQVKFLEYVRDYNKATQEERTMKMREAKAQNAAEKVVKATEKSETKEEKQKIEEAVKEGLDEQKPASEISMDIKEEINYNYNDEKKVDEVVKKELETKPLKIVARRTMETQTQQEPKRTMESQTQEEPKRTMETQTQQEPKRTMETQTQEPIVEISKVSEQEQIRRDEAVPTDFSMPSMKQQMKEGKTTLQELQSKMPSKLQKGEQLLLWVNKVGGYNNYEYLRSKFNLVDEVNGDMNYLKKMDDCLVNIYGGDIGVSNVSSYSDVVSLKQCVRELNIMRNCFYITKFKSALPPQYGLIVGLNRMMSMADLLGRQNQNQPMPNNQPMPDNFGNKIASSEVNQPMPDNFAGKIASSEVQPMRNKPVVRGQERIEYEEQKSELINRAIEPEPERRGRRLNPQIKQENIEEANMNRGYRSMSQTAPISIHQKVLSGNVAQADTIARGIRLKPAKKQF